MFSSLFDNRRVIAFVTVVVFNVLVLLLYPAFVGNSAWINLALEAWLSYASISILFRKEHSIIWAGLWSITMLFGPLGLIGVIPTGLYWYLFSHRKKSDTAEEDEEDEEAEEAEETSDSLLNDWLEEAILSRDRKSLRAITKAKKVMASSNPSPTPKKHLPRITQHARVPIIRVPIPFFTYTLSEEGVRKHWALGKHGRDPEEWANIKNLDISGELIAHIVGCGTLCFQSNKLGELEYRRWRFIPVKILDNIEKYHQQASKK